MAALTFTDPPGWQGSPRIPARTAGVLCIQSDDGWLGDWTHWVPTIVAAHRQHSRWWPPVPFTPNVNSGTIDDASRMRVEHLRRIEEIGGEIISHGRWHIRAGALETTQALDPGATLIPTSPDPGAANGAGQDMTYLISGGGESETFVWQDSSGGAMVPADPLTHGYPSGTTVQLTADSTTTLLQGCLDDLAAWGVGAAHHVFTWHHHDQLARDRAAQVFVSARGRAGLETGPGVDYYQLRGRLITVLDESIIASELDEVVADDGAMIVYGHGETDDAILGLLAYLVDQALGKGVRIVTRTELVAHLQAKGW